LVSREERKGAKTGAFAGCAREGYEAGMQSEKSLFDSPEAEARSEARAKADVRAGRLISHEAVRRWVSSWGSARRLPRPRVGG